MDISRHFLTRKSPITEHFTAPVLALGHGFSCRVVFSTGSTIKSSRQMKHGYKKGDGAMSRLE
jgi:hypothetical protein